MKCCTPTRLVDRFLVTLHVRVWIEMLRQFRIAFGQKVTLHVRVWIEIRTVEISNKKQLVTLHVRVWIEIPS